jgi:uncharacterized protein YqeY
MRLNITVSCDQSIFFDAMVGIPAGMPQRLWPRIPECETMRFVRKSAVHDARIERRLERRNSMPLKDKLASDLKDAMRAGDGVRRDVLRGLLTAISNTEIARVNVKEADAGREDLTDGETIDVIQKQAKQRRESIEEFKKAGRQDLVDREKAELEILSAYLPQQLSRDEIVEQVRQVIAETGATGAADKNKVMPAAIARMKGRADGRAINEVVSELLK